MAMGKSGFYMSILFVIVLFGSMFIKVGNDFINDPDVTLDQKSQDYLSKYELSLNENNLTELGESSGISDADILKSTEEGEASSDDVFATINFYKSKVEQVLDFFKVLGNAPIFLLIGLGLPLEPFTIFTNVFSVVFWVSLMLLIVKLIRGS